MHEMALAEGVLSVVLDAAEEQKVRRIRLLIGKLQLVVRDSFDFSFQLASAGTPAEEAAVEIEEIPARFRCKKCGEVSELNQPPFQCLQCNNTDVEVVSGEEMLVDEVELENGEVIRRRVVPADEILAEHMKEHHAGGH